MIRPIADYLQGTGLRGSAAQPMWRTDRGSIASVVSIGSGADPGADQVQIIVPRSLRSGRVSIVNSLWNGQTANVLTLAIQ